MPDTSFFLKGVVIIFGFTGLFRSGFLFLVSPRSVGSDDGGGLEDRERRGGRWTSLDKEARKAKNIEEQLERGKEWGVGVYPPS